jgi:hypothetical protein
VGEGAGVVDDVVCELALLVQRHLRADAPHRLFAPVALALQLSLHLQVLGHPDHHGGVEGQAGGAVAAGPAPLEEKRDVEHHQRRPGLPGGHQAAGHLGPHLGMDEGVQTPPRLRIAEHDGAERLAVEGTRRVDHLGPEGRRDLRQQRLSRRLKLVDDGIGVDHGGA